MAAVTALREPCEALYASWVECVSDFAEETSIRDGLALHGSPAWRIPDFSANRDSFERLIAASRQERDTTQRLPEGLVHCDSYWVIDEEQTVIGFAGVRHHLGTDFLRTEGGHLGYSIRPSRRRRGHASRVLALLLDRSREIGIEAVLLTCVRSNIASARTIEGHGGVYEGDYADKRRYWIKL